MYYPYHGYDVHGRPASGLSNKSMLVEEQNVYCADVCSCMGFLRFLCMVCGAVCLGLMIHYTSSTGLSSFAMAGYELFFLLVVFGCLLGTFLLLLSSFWSLTSSSLLARTSFEMLFHFLACLLYLVSAIIMLTRTIDRKNAYRASYYSEEVYNAKIAAAVIGILNGVFYFLSIVLSVRIFRAG